jgi:hypothetical protein
MQPGAFFTAEPHSFAAAAKFQPFLAIGGYNVRPRFLAGRVGAA